MSEWLQSKSQSDVITQIMMSVAHELNNPNGYIRVNTSNIKKMFNLVTPCFLEFEKNHPHEKFGPYTLPEIRSKILKLIDVNLQATVRIMAIADRLKNVVNLANQDSSELSLKTILNLAIDNERFIINDCAELEFKVDDNQDPKIIGHQLQLEQAFSILLTNAVDAIHERFQKEKEICGKICISLQEKDKEVHINFEDNGCGMDEEVLSKIFIPYFTTKPQGRGEGIGLSLCKSIINRFGGSISASSTLGKGTIFTVTFPKS